MGWVWGDNAGPRGHWRTQGHDPPKLEEWLQEIQEQHIEDLCPEQGGSRKALGSALDPIAP